MVRAISRGNDHRIIRVYPQTRPMAMMMIAATHR
jgi:hypothetical protein